MTAVVPVHIHSGAALGTHPGWRTALLWVASGFSLPIAGYVANQVAGSIDSPLRGALGGAIAGTVLGAAQWLVIRGRIGRADWWAPATALGFAAGLAAGTAAIDAGTSGRDLVISGAITGAAIGAAQFLAVRGSSKLAPAWIPIMAVSWSAAWATTWAAGIDVDEGWTNFGASGVVVFGILTAAALPVVRLFVPTDRDGFGARVGSR